MVFNWVDSSWYGKNIGFKNLLTAEINGDSFGDALEDQLKNIVIGAASNMAAGAIGKSYKSGDINKATQLALHAGLGSAAGEAGGGDCASGAVSGVVGEMCAEFAAASLSYSDLIDKESSYDKSFGIQTNFSVGGGKSKDGKQQKMNPNPKASNPNQDSSRYPRGSTTISLKNRGYEKEGITRATIGNGTITIAGNSNPDLTGLNRYITKSQEVTKDMITNALEGKVTIDHRFFSREGRKNIGDNFKNLDRNLGISVDMTAGATARATIGAFTMSAEAFKNHDDIKKEYKAKGDPHGYVNDPRYDDNAHEKAAYKYGEYVKNPAIAGLFRGVGEIGQFFYYTGDDLARRLVPGGENKGMYQPYKFSPHNGGIIDSWNDTSNVIDGARGGTFSE